MRQETILELMRLTSDFEVALKSMEQDSNNDVSTSGRSYGGAVRSRKGALHEALTEDLINIVWKTELQRDASRLNVNKKKVRIPIRPDYLIRFDEVQHSQMSAYHFDASVDWHVHVDGKFVLGIECKAFTENAMIKRILTDFFLLKSSHPEIDSVLLQLESQLGGDFSTELDGVGSRSTHTLMSFFPAVNLKVLTLMDGERSPDKPINKPGFFKSLSKTRLEHAASEFRELLNGY